MAGLEVVILTVETVAALLTLSTWVVYGLSWLCRQVPVAQGLAACAA